MARPNIKTSTGILNLLNQSLLDLKEGKIDDARAKTITYICTTAGQIIKNLELEKRIEELEKEVEERGL
jgi:hypothetical protein